MSTFKLVKTVTKQYVAYLDAIDFDDAESQFDSLDDEELGWEQEDVEEYQLGKINCIQLDENEENEVDSKEIG